MFTPSLHTHATDICIASDKVYINIVFYSTALYWLFLGHQCCRRVQRPQPLSPDHCAQTAGWFWNRHVCTGLLGNISILFHLFTFWPMWIFWQCNQCEWMLMYTHIMCKHKIINNASMIMITDYCEVQDTNPESHTSNKCRLLRHSLW